MGVVHIPNPRGLGWPVCYLDRWPWARRHIVDGWREEWKEERYDTGDKLAESGLEPTCQACLDRRRLWPNDLDLADRYNVTKMGR